MPTKLIALAAACFAALWGQSALAAVPTSTILDALRTATLARPLASISSIHTAGNIEVLGLRGTEQEWDDLRDTRYADAQDAGALSGASGWDGRVAWSQDYAGLVTIDGGTSGRLQAIDQAYLAAFGYLRPGAGGATVIYAGKRTEGAKSYDVLAVTPPRGSELDLWIDPQTHLIARETATIGIISATTSLSNYRRVDGITYPFFTSTRTSTGNSGTVRLKSLLVNADVSGRMRVPAQNVRDFSIADEQSTTVPLQIINNHLYLTVRLNGKGPYTFVLDSGGDYIVTPEVAAALGARSAGAARIGGVGNATEGAAFTQVDSIAVGDAVVRNQYMLVLPIATGFGMAEGLHIDGMIGYQFLARFVATIDYAGSKLTLALPGASAPSVPNAAAIPFYFDGTTPRVPIAVDGVATTAEVDTGSRAGLTLSSPFLTANPAIAALAKTPPGVDGFGVGGPSYARLGRIPTLQIGPYTVSNSVAGFGVQSKGAFADPFNPANVGGAIWRRFELTLDYARQQIFLAKNASFDSPFGYDRSGLFLIDANGAYTVISTFPGSPGAAAALAKGDVILTVNGAPAANTSLADLRALLSGPAGSVVRLRVRGASGERDVQLALADYV